MTGRPKVTDALIPWVLTSRNPPGHKYLLEFLRDVEAGVIPQTEATKHLATAFEQIIFDGRAANDVLQLKSPRGRPPQSHREVMSRDSQRILRFMLQYVESDQKRGNITRAVKSAAHKYKKDERRIWLIWKEREHSLRWKVALKIMAQRNETIQAYATTLTVEKRRKFLALDSFACFQIASAAQNK